MSLIERYRELSERQQRRVASAAAALMVAVAMVVGDITGDGRKSTPRPLAPPEAPPFTVVPEVATVGQVLKSGNLLNGKVEFNANESVGIDCHAKSDTIEKRWSRDLYTGTQYLEALGPNESFIFLGEAMDSGQADKRRYKRGLVLGHNRATGMYRLLTFEVQEQRDEGSLRDLLPLEAREDAIAAPVSGLETLTSDELYKGQTFAYGNLIATITLDDRHPSGLPVGVILGCKPLR